MSSRSPDVNHPLRARRRARASADGMPERSGGKGGCFWRLRGSASRWNPSGEHQTAVRGVRTRTLRRCPSPISVARLSSRLLRPHCARCPERSPARRGIADGRARWEAGGALPPEKGAMRSNDLRPGGVSVGHQHGDVGARPGQALPRGGISPALVPVCLRVSGLGRCHLGSVGRTL